jgi:formylglycine-generating enzyme required for sulfatase activity
MSGDVFFSYSHKDHGVVQKVFEDLKLRGVSSIWMDRSALEPGHDWKREVNKGIDECTCMVLFVSSSALESDEVQYEYTRAYQEDKEIIPLLLEPFANDALPEIVRKYQWVETSPREIDLQSPDYVSALVRLTKRLPRVEHVLPSMIKIPAGSCEIGERGEEFALELPDFWLGKTPVTVFEYACFVRAEGLKTSKYWREDTLKMWSAGPRDASWPSKQLYEFALEHPLQPMRGVAWYEAMAYCAWLSHITNHPFTLPSEAQWEKAARGTGGRTWAFGSSWNPHAADVSSKDATRDRPRDCGNPASASPYGCLDMAGGVWNWTLSADLMRPYYEDGRGEQLADLGAPRIIRGGSWRTGPAKARTYHRESQKPIPEDYRYDIGFRVATDSDPSSLFEGALSGVDTP